MIFDHRENIVLYTKSFPFLKEIGHFLSELSSTSSLQFEKMELSPSIYVMNQRIYSKKDVRLESHRIFADVHVPLNTTEKILFASAGLGQIEPYNESDDVEFFSGSTNTELLVSPDQFVLLLPGEAHAPGFAADKTNELHKLVFKIKI